MQDLKDQNNKHYCLIALGGNLSSATHTALDTLKESLGLFDAESLMIHRISEWYSTKAFPKGSGPDYVNGAVLVETSLSPQEVLAALHRIEKTHGRKRLRRWGARTCDLDLIAYDDLVLPDIETYQHWSGLSPQEQISQTPDQLILPHPRVQDRAFVLVPLDDIAPDWVHPVTGMSIREMRIKLPRGLLAEVAKYRE